MIRNRSANYGNKYSKLYLKGNEMANAKPIEDVQLKPSKSVCATITFKV